MAAHKSHPHDSLPATFAARSQEVVALPQFRLEELGTSKASIKRCFLKWYDRPSDDEWAARVAALLNSGRALFTLDELELLVSVFETAHHRCVLDNEEDYSPLVVWTHKQLDERLERWHDLIHQRRLADASRGAA